MVAAFVTVSINQTFSKSHSRWRNQSPCFRRRLRPSAYSQPRVHTNVSSSLSSRNGPATFRESQRSSHGYESILDCVLKVYCIHCEPNYELPWAMTAQRQSTSSAFIIENRQILTNAHSVEHHTMVMVKKRYSDTKYPAKVVAIGNECDIALLSVDSEEFWEDFENHELQTGEDDIERIPFLSPGPLPHLQDPVMVIGYPSPGNQISVTAGVSSRVEMQHYVHGQGELLAVQIDAAVSLRIRDLSSCMKSLQIMFANQKLFLSYSMQINPGNSGGPVINESHQVIGTILIMKFVYTQVNNPYATSDFILHGSFRTQASLSKVWIQVKQILLAISFHIAL